MSIFGRRFGPMLIVIAIGFALLSPAASAAERSADRGCKQIAATTPALRIERLAVGTYRIALRRATLREIFAAFNACLGASRF